MVYTIHMDGHFSYVAIGLLDVFRYRNKVGFSRLRRRDESTTRSRGFCVRVETYVQAHWLSRVVEATVTTTLSSLSMTIRNSSALISRRNVAQWNNSDQLESGLCGLYSAHI
jgi:hypothetical protein